MIRVERIARGESSEQAVLGRSRSLMQAANDFEVAQKQSSPVEDLKNAGKTALNTLQLLFWAVIIAGGAYLVSKARR